MSGSGRAGSGHGNNRRRQSRRRDNDDWQDGEYTGYSSPGNDASRKADNSGRNENSRGGSGHDRRNSRRSGAFSRSGSEEQERGRRRRQPEHLRTRGISSGTEENHRNASSGRRNENFRGERTVFFDRPKWTPPKQNTEPLPVPDCPYCGKPIRDLASAMTDKDSGVPVHFDCAAVRIAGSERLERGESVVYIGGGRFGIVNFGRSETSPASMPRAAGRDFRIRKIIEWENKDKRAEWRAPVCDHYSVT